MGILKHCAMYKSSTSNALHKKSGALNYIHFRMRCWVFILGFKPPYQRSTCRLEKVFKAASRVKSLKPHCVSLIPLTQKNHTRKWNPYIRKVRNTDRCYKTKPKYINAKCSAKEDKDFSHISNSYCSVDTLRNTSYLSHWFFFQMSSGSTGDCHVLLHENETKGFSDRERSLDLWKGMLCLICFISL